MIKFRIIAEQKLIATCNWGQTSIEEIMTLRRNLRADPAFSHRYDAIVDSSQLESTFTRDEIENVVSTRLFDSGQPAGKIAVIAPSDLQFGISRMHESISEIYDAHLNICVFRDAASALKWLDRENLEIEIIFREIKGLE